MQIIMFAKRAQAFWVWEEWRSETTSVLIVGSFRIDLLPIADKTFKLRVKSDDIVL